MEADPQWGTSYLKATEQARRPPTSIAERIVSAATRVPWAPTTSSLQAAMAEGLTEDSVVCEDIEPDADADPGNPNPPFHVRLANLDVAPWFSPHDGEVHGHRRWGVAQGTTSTVGHLYLLNPICLRSRETLGAVWLLKSGPMVEKQAWDGDIGALLDAAPPDGMEQHEPAAALLWRCCMIALSVYLAAHPTTNSLWKTVQTTDPRTPWTLLVSAAWRDTANKDTTTTPGFYKILQAGGECLQQMRIHKTPCLAAPSAGFFVRTNNKWMHGRRPEA